MGVYIKNRSLADWKELLKWAKIGANNAMIGEFAEVEEIPPHGRLIDADAAAKQGWTISRTYSASPTEMVYEVKTMTDEVLPTIIPASEEVDG